MTDAPILAISRRTRATPWTEQVTAAGVKGYTVYNSMLLPTTFRGLEADYEHLANHVQVWDVACERQVQLKGPDALKLLQLMTPRDMEKMRDGRCFYIPICDSKGKLLNDPVAFQVGAACYWVSISSSDLLFYAKGLATGFDLDVEIEEPDINPLAIQGPKAQELMVRVFGDEVASIKFFRFKWLTFQDVPMVVARTGFSGRGGFEIYVPGPAYEGGKFPKLAKDLWDTFFAVGEDLNVGAGCPNLIDFMEVGLLSFGNTIDYGHSPFEAGLGKYCDGLDTCLGGEALRAEAEQGPKRQVRGLKFATDDFSLSLIRDWPVQALDGRVVGIVSAVAPSLHLGVPMGIGTIDKASWDAGTPVNVMTPQGPRDATICDLPFRR